MSAHNLEAAGASAPRHALSRSASVALLCALTIWLGACAVSTGWPRLAPASAEAGDERVVLVLTKVVVDAKARAEFDRQTSRVLSGMGQHPGLLGYAARRQLFGNQGWTMSVWASDAARSAFVNSSAHREAIAKSLPALVTVELKRLTVARKDLPPDWDAVLRLLDDPVGLRNYWE
jgi:quinol monooxygenase YgiN